MTPTEISFPTLTSQQLTLYPSTSTPTEAAESTATATATADSSSTPQPTATTSLPTPTPVPQLPTASPTPYTLEGFQEEFKTTLENFAEYGISEQTIRSIYEAQLYREKLQEDLTKDLPPTEEHVLARHILVETEEEANAIYDRLQNGEDFAAVAQETSKDTASAANGGILDWQPRSFFVTEFADAAFSQEIGEIGQPVQSDFGYHIILVIAREELPLNATQLEQKKETEFTNWLTAAKEDADITTYDSWQAVVPTEPSLQAQQPAVPQ